MPNLRKALITVFATGAVLAAPAAPHALAAARAPAAAVQHTSARQVAAGESAPAPVTAAPAKVHRAACTSLTFNVYHDHALRPLCYAGTGAIKPDIKAVREITAGNYWGCLIARAGRMTISRSFKPHMILRFPSRIELTYFRLARHPVACPA